jgi:hypothetical protein
MPYNFSQHPTNGGKGRKLFTDKTLDAAIETWKLFKNREDLEKTVNTFFKENGGFSYEKQQWLECIARTKELVVGDRYWISQDWEHTGAWVKILEKSTELNRVGLPSLVTVEVVKPVGAYKLGEVKTMNATNIYDHKAHSSLENFRKKMAGEPYLTPSS